MASEFACVCGNDLIKRNRVLIGSVTSRCRTGQVLIGIGMAMNFSNSRVRQPGINGDFIAQRLEHIEYLGQFKIVLAAMREPAPILPGRICFERQTHTIRMVDADKTFRCRFVDWEFSQQTSQTVAKPGDTCTVKETVCDSTEMCF